MSEQQQERVAARYRFDPHSGGNFLGLGRVRLAVLLFVLVLGVAALYRGQPLGALVCLGPGAVLVLWTREGIPALVWLPLRLRYRIGDPDRRGWSLDPELLPHTQPTPTPHTPRERPEI